MESSRDRDRGTNPSVDIEFNLISCTNSEDIPHQLSIRILAFLCIIASIVEMIYAIPIYKFLVNMNLGAFWGAIPILLAGIPAARGSARGWILAGCLLSACGIGTGLFGALSDDLAKKVFKSIDACGTPLADGIDTPQGLTFVGNPEYFWGAQKCFLNDLNQHPVITSNCYCAQVQDNNSTAICGFYMLSAESVAAGYNCSDLSGFYARGLASSAEILAVATLFCLCLSLVSCTSLCCAKPNASRFTPVALSSRFWEDFVFLRYFVVRVYELIYI